MFHRSGNQGSWRLELVVQSSGVPREGTELEWELSLSDLTAQGFP